MTERIYKYKIEEFGTTELTLPAGARVLDFQYETAGLQKTLVCWAIVNPDTPERQTRKFRVLATGDPYDFKGRKYRKTVQDCNGFVWHIFEILK